MPTTLERSERRGDRNRRRILVPGEAVTPLYDNGTVRVVVQADKTAAWLVRREDFMVVGGDVDPATPVVVSVPPAAPKRRRSPIDPPDTEAKPPVAEPVEPVTSPRERRVAELTAKNRKAQMGLARELKIRGRGNMREGALVSAIADAETDDK